MLGPHTFPISLARTLLNPNVTIDPERAWKIKR